MARYLITPKVLTDLGANEVPELVIVPLWDIENQSIRGKRRFQSILHRVIGSEATYQYGELISKLARVKFWDWLVPLENRAKLQRLTFWHIVLKILKSTIIAALIMAAIYVLDREYSYFFPNAGHHEIELLNFAKAYGSILTFLIYLTHEVLKNVGVRGYAGN